MSWIRIDDSAPEHPKLIRAGTSACWLWVCGLAYCSRHLTDGIIPSEAIERFGVAGAAKHAAQLVAVGLWEQTSGGYLVHDYHEYQPSRSQVETRRERSAQRLKAWREANSYIGGNAHETLLHDDVKDERNAVSTINPVPVPVPVPKEPKKKNMSSRLDEPDGFAEFWATYPRKDARKDALKAYRALKPTPDLRAVMLAAIARHRVSRQWQDGFIPLAATWIRGERWTDAGAASLPAVSAPARPMGEAHDANFTRSCDVCRTPFAPPRYQDGSVRYVYTCPACMEKDAEALRR